MELTKELYMDTLKQVAEDLKSGVIPPEKFTMDTWRCGSVMCIGGWVEHRLILSGFKSEQTYSFVEILYKEDPRLHDLYYNWKGDPTPQQSAEAVRKYFETKGYAWAL